MKPQVWLSKHSGWCVNKGTRNPDQLMPVVNPDQLMPVVNPDQLMPVVNPDQLMPVVNPDQLMPVVNPDLLYAQLCCMFERTLTRNQVLIFVLTGK